MAENIGKVVGREKISDLSSAVGFSAAYLPATNPRVSLAWIQPIGGNIRVCVDGTTPTASVGIKIPDGTIMQLDSGRLLGQTDFTTSEMTLFKCIRESGSLTPALEVIYFGGN